MKQQQTISSEKIYEGYAMTVECLQILLPNGEKSSRDIIRRIGASAIVPIDNDGYVYMVKQFRTPLEKTLLELPTGMFDYIGEKPLDCATRELSEETGFTAGKITYLTSIHTSPGFLDEKIHIYIAEDLLKGKKHLDEDEFLEVKRYPLDDLLLMVANGQISDAKSIVGLLYTKQFIDFYKK